MQQHEPMNICYNKYVPHPQPYYPAPQHKGINTYKRNNLQMFFILAKIQTYGFMDGN